MLPITVPHRGLLGAQYEADTSPFSLITAPKTQLCEQQVCKASLHAVLGPVSEVFGVL